MKTNILERILALSSSNARDLVGVGSSSNGKGYAVSLARDLIDDSREGEYHHSAKRVARALKASIKDGEENYGPWCRQLMLETMQIFHAELFPPNYSKSLVTIYERESERILDTLLVNDPSYTLDDDIFVKDIMCFTGRLVPCGMYIIDVFSGFPRSYLTKPNLFSLLPNLVFFAKTGGFRRYAQVHVHKPTINQFSQSGRNDCFRRIAEILELEPALLGLIGSAWYYDPALQEISPHLSYLGRDPLNHGGRLIDLGETSAARQNALSKSSKRRELYDQGAYSPRQFMLVLSKKDLLEWVSQMGFEEQNVSGAKESV